jgi:hypothetical protein
VRRLARYAHSCIFHCQSLMGTCRVFVARAAAAPSIHHCVQYGVPPRGEGAHCFCKFHARHAHSQMRHYVVQMPFLLKHLVTVLEKRSRPNTAAASVPWLILLGFTFSRCASVICTEIKTVMFQAAAQVRCTFGTPYDSHHASLNRRHKGSMLEECLHIFTPSTRVSILTRHLGR